MTTQRMFPCFSKGGLNQKNLLGDFHFLLDDFHFLLDDGKNGKNLLGFQRSQCFFSFFERNKDNNHKNHKLMMFIYISIFMGGSQTKNLRSSVPSRRFLLGAGMRNEAMNVRSGHASPQEIFGVKASV